MSYFNYRRAAVLCAMLLGLFITSVVNADNNAQNAIVNGFCSNMDFSTIPVGDFSQPHVLPEEDLHITQKYNTGYADGYDVSGTWYYGHDGLDVDGASQSPGVNDVKAIFPGMVILSQDENHTGGKKGWGESIIIATRANLYSDEIITHHYHHMWSDSNGTTRRFNACDPVKAGDTLGKEDDTGNSHGSHLHLTTRRWKNIRELLEALKQGGKALFGHGYTFGDNSKIARHLDPEGLIFNTFRDYQLDPNNLPPMYNWSLPYVLDMRRRGIEFGLFDGRYGAGETVTRREAARWLKIASQRFNATPAIPTFEDVPATDADYPYIEAMTTYPSKYPVINRNAGITNGKKYFYPDEVVTRAQALKMVILSFYSAEFLEVYDNYIWKSGAAAATQLLSQFQDVNPLEWYAPFVYFGAQKGLVQIQQHFNPYSIVRREEMAKWISEGANTIELETHGPCSYLTCPADYFCDPASTHCYAIPTCVPSETNPCEPGGGYTGTDMCQDVPQCTPGQTDEQGCFAAGLPGTQTRTCGSNCTWNPWVTCVATGVCIPGQTLVCGNCGTQTCDDEGQWAQCFNQGVCAAGQVQSQPCNASGTQSRSCEATCNWGSWSPCSVNPVCATGDSQQKPCNSGTGTQIRICNATGQWDDWGVCQPNGVCSDGQTLGCGNCGVQICGAGQWGLCQNQGVCAAGQSQSQPCNGAGTQTRTCGNTCTWDPWSACSVNPACSPGQTDTQNCTTGGGQAGTQTRVCDANGQWGGWGICSTQCQDVYLASASPACYTNPQGPAFCISVQQVSGPTWQYQVCKQGSFVNDYKTVLHDDNHSFQLGDTYNGNSGDTCTPWRTFSVAYISGYGTPNAAGVRGEIFSPASCSQASCTYSAGTITIRRECQ